MARRRGFTLVEVLVVMSLLGVLMGLSIGLIANSQTGNKLLVATNALAGQLASARAQSAGSNTAYVVVRTAPDGKNIPLSDFDYNRYGGMAGGPMVLPGYDGRGRTFFLYGFEGIHESRPRNNGTPTVPTERMRTGDFSELLALGSQYQIYNPFTRRAIGGGRYQQDPFPGNIIPQHLINPVARAALEYFAHPLTAGNADGTSNFQNPSLPEDIKYANNTVRVDHNLTDKQRMYGRFSWYDRNSNYNNYFGNLATGEWFKFISRQAAVDHVYVMTPSTVLNFRYGYNWFVRGTDSNPANHDFDLTSLGFPASYNASIPDGIRRFPRFDITEYQGTGIGIPQTQQTWCNLHSRQILVQEVARGSNNSGDAGFDTSV